MASAVGAPDRGHRDRTPGDTAMARFTFVVFSNPVDGREKEYNDWYDTVHLQDVARVPGVVSARRLRFNDVVNPDISQYRYLALYEWEAENVQAARSALDVAREAGLVPVHDALDPASVQAAFYEAIGDPMTAG
ncbi:MAG TPA: hypothetical protein VG205_06710 [Acidimicrobiales bacterium]|nr:hypothetical protein [Acidimicrobiales bacterium]